MVAAGGRDDGLNGGIDKHCVDVVGAVCACIRHEAVLTEGVWRQIDLEAERLKAMDALLHAMREGAGAGPGWADDADGIAGS